MSSYSDSDDDPIFDPSSDSSQTSSSNSNSDLDSSSNSSSGSLDHESGPVHAEADAFRHARQMVKWHSILLKTNANELKNWMNECVDTFIQNN